MECSATFIGGLFLFSSCGSQQKEVDSKKEETAAKVADPCNDFTGVNAEELEKRKKLGYTGKSEVANKSCGNCGLYIAFTEPAAVQCGKCLLFKGPVHAEGHCLQYVAKT
ncbi:MAG: hypothetical protein IT249_19030 [Chitinophagaceae bacterium]|nr:hypothetical protein [Chitinophagaceae bacterium]